MFDAIYYMYSSDVQHFVCFIFLFCRKVQSRRALDGLIVYVSSGMLSYLATNPMEFCLNRLQLLSRVKHLPSIRGIWLKRPYVQLLDGRTP